MTTTSPRARSRGRARVPRSVADAMQRPISEVYAEIFSALQEPLRLRILMLVASAGTDEFPCTSLEKELPVAKSTISYHVKILRKAGLLSVRKEGRYFRYTAREDFIEHFLPGMLDTLIDEDGAP